MNEKKSYDVKLLILIYFKYLETIYTISETISHLMIILLYTYIILYE